MNWIDFICISVIVVACAVVIGRALILSDAEYEKQKQDFEDRKRRVQETIDQGARRWGDLEP